MPFPEGSPTATPSRAAKPCSDSPTARCASDASASAPTSRRGRAGSRPARHAGRRSLDLRERPGPAHGRGSVPRAAHGGRSRGPARLAARVSRPPGRSHLDRHAPAHGRPACGRDPRALRPARAHQSDDRRGDAFAGRGQRALPRRPEPRRADAAGPRQRGLEPVLGLARRLRPALRHPRPRSSEARRDRRPRDRARHRGGPWRPRLLGETSLVSRFHRPRVRLVPDRPEGATTPDGQVSSG